MKLPRVCLLSSTESVTPFTGVWIEIVLVVDLAARAAVTPFTGVWIEIPV